MAEAKEDLILADEVGEGDERAVCHIEPCGLMADVVIGQEAELEYCPDHAARLAVELLDLPLVQRALQKQGKLVLALDQAQVGHLRLITRKAGRLPATAQEYRSALHATLTAHVQTTHASRRPAP